MYGMVIKLQPRGRGIRPDDKDKVTLAVNGGIDLNAKHMGLDISKEGAGVRMKFDAASIAEFQRGNFSGITPVILRIIPISSPFPLLGMGPDQN